MQGPIRIRFTYNVLSIIWDSDGEGVIDNR